MLGTLGARSSLSSPGGLRDFSLWANGGTEAWVFGGTGVGTAAAGSTGQWWSERRDVFRLELASHAATWTWMGREQTPGARRHSAAWPLGGGGALLFGGGGGGGGGGDGNDTWHFSPNCTHDVRVARSNTSCAGATGARCAVVCDAGYLPTHRA